MQIIPAILETDIDKFFKQLDRLSPYFSHFQIDIIDGKFAPNKTVQIEEIIKRITNYELRIREKVFDFHLMVNDYKPELTKLRRLKDSIKIENVLLHMSVLKTEHRELSNQYDIGFVLNPEDEIDANWETIRQSEIIQIMTVKPGFQGAPFLPEQLNKIDRLRDRGFRGKILLDGGISNKTISQIIARQNIPNAMGIGSYITRAKDLEKLTEEIKKLVPNAVF